MREPAFTMFPVRLISLGSLLYLLNVILTTEGKLSQYCTISNTTIDCSHRYLSDHFNDSDWATNSSFDSVIYDHNNIVHLKSFPVISIYKLSFRHNGIVKIDDAAFRFVKHLTEIDLSHNHLTSTEFTGDAFRGVYSLEGYEPLPSLQILRLSGNSLHTLHPDVFEHLPNLRVLALDSNPLKMIDQPTIYALASIPLLRNLDLSSTMIRELPTAMLHTPRYLEVLNLSNNAFKEIPLGIGDCHSLRHLAMNNNPIKILSFSPNVPTLKILEISSMPQLKVISSKALSNFGGLEELYCTDNTQLVEIANDTFVSHIDGQGYTWPPIKKIHLNNNQLGYLDPELISRWEQIEEWNLEMNPWVCDCLNQWFLSKMMPLLFRLHPEQAERLRCHEPIEMRGVSIHELSIQNVQMRCLDAYGHQPEKDAVVLVYILACVICVPLICAALVVFIRHLNTPKKSLLLPKFKYQRTASMETIS